MSIDLVLKPACGACGSAEELYGSSCKHLTLCETCGTSMAEKRSECSECGTPITRLIREYNLRASFSNDKNYFIGSFASGFPSFEKNENEWSFHKEGLKGRQVTEALREKFKNRPWLLENETGQFQYRGHLEGTEGTTYYVLMRLRKELIAFPASSWYCFNKVPQYKQLTSEEAEAIMKGRRIAAKNRQKWMIDAARSKAAAFGKVEKPGDREGGGGGGRRHKKTTGDDDKDSDRGEEDEEEEEAEIMSLLGINERSGDDGDEEGFGGGDFDDDDDGGGDIQKGDWEYEEIFSDDDEAIGELDDLDPETEPPEINQDDEDEDDEEYGLEGLSISGKEIKKLLGRALKDYNTEHGKVDMEDDISKKEAPKEKPVDRSSPLKVTTSVLKAPSASKSSKGKKSSREGSRTPNGAAVKKVKIKHCNAKLNSSLKAPELLCIYVDAIQRVDAFTATKGKEEKEGYNLV